MAANRDPLAGRRLDSWKEIAAFFGRAERTVKRWETDRGLPVQRVPGSGRGSVFAYTDELAEWLKGRGHEIGAEESLSAESPLDRHAAAGMPEPKSLAASLALSAKLALASRVTAWLLPLLLAGCLIVFLSVGRGGVRFKALAGRHGQVEEAQDLYLKGRYFWDRRTPEDLNKAIDYFTQAIVKDPSDAQSYVGLADCYNLLREFGTMPPGEAYPRALAAAQRAVELDDTSADAHNSLAFVTYWWSWQGLTAEREFKRALELNPNLGRAHHWYATYLLARHRLSEALMEMEEARKLEPSSTAILADKGFLLWKAGQQAKGLSLLKQLEMAEPSLSSTHDYLGRIYWEQKDYPRALAEWRRLAELRHDVDGLALADAREKGFAAGRLEGLRQSELPVQKELVDRGSGDAYDLATTYAALGQLEEAQAYLQISFDRHEAAMLIGDPNPVLDNDPEYQKLRTIVSQRLVE